MMKVYREEEVYSALSRHASAISEGVEIVREAIDMIVSGDAVQVAKKMERVFSLKREADLVIRAEVKKLSGSRFSPENRADLLELMVASEKIISAVETVAYTLSMLSAGEIDVSSLPESIERGMQEMAKSIAMEIGLLKKALLTLAEDPLQVTEICNGAADMENQVDHLYYETMVALMKEGKTYNPSKFFLIREIILGLEDIADRGEDLADKIRIILAERT